MRSGYLILALALPLAAAKETPAWIQEAAHRPMPSYSSKVTQEVLFSEERLTVAPDGKRNMTERQAIRILQTSKHSLSAFRTYNTKTGRIRDFRAWLLPPSGQLVEYDKKRIVDVALDQQGSYDEARAKVIECNPNSPPGTIFAYEVTEEEDTIFTTYQYAFQDADPTAVSRFVLTLPVAWEVSGTLFNHSPVPPQTSANTYTWELHDLPWVEQQEYGPGLHDLAPRLGVTYFPASTPNHALAPLKDWPAVSAWFARFADPAAALTPLVSAKTAGLTSGAANDMDRIRALAKYAQQTNYVSVQMNIEHGGGYTPRPATDVLQKNYGDCKDKATLLRALLKGAGIDSYAVSLYSGDRDFVKPEWASPMQFNHAIIAIKLPVGVDSPAAVESAKLGHLLIFDPTDPYTPVGDLPEDEQGSWALIAAAQDGDLVRLPTLPPSSNRIQLAVEGTLAPSGEAKAHVSSEYFGQSASFWRAVSHETGKDEMKKALEAVFTRRLGAGVALDHISASDASSKLDIALDLQVAHLGQTMMDKLLVVKPGALAPDHGYNFPKMERKQPIRLTARMRTDKMTLHLPEGYAVDELPAEVTLNCAYGAYHSIWKTAGGVVTMEQSLEVRDAQAPAADYAKVRDFFDHVSGAQFAPLVLAKH